MGDKDVGSFQDEWIAFVVMVANIIGHGKLPPLRSLCFAIYQKLSRMGIVTLRSGLYGMRGVVDTIDKFVLFPLEYPVLAGLYGARASSLLLAGAPGTGKTHIMHHIMMHDRAVIFARVTGDKLRKDIGGDHPSRVLDRISKIRERTKVKVILLIDDIETLLQDDEILNRFLELMNGIYEGGFLVLASTNNPEKIDYRILQPGRFDMVLHVGLPTREERVGVLRIHLHGKPFVSDAERKRTINRIADRTECWSQRLLEAVVRYAGHTAGQEQQVSEQGVLMEWRHFDEALKFVQRTNNLKQLREADADIARYVSHMRGRIEGFVGSNHSGANVNI